MYDPDDTPDANRESEAFEQFLQDASDCDLRNWDREFIDDLLGRVKKRGAQAVLRALTARQQEQLTRIKEYYDVEESEQNFLV